MRYHADRDAGSNPAGASALWRSLVNSLSNGRGQFDSAEE